MRLQLYTLSLVLLRIWHSKTGAQHASLWDHTALIYMCNFFFTLVPLRSSIIHPPSETAEIITVVRFALITLVCLITVTVRKGNSVVVQEVKDGLEPSREPTASLLSLASFSWVDNLIWKGFQHPLELKDIWNLRNDDLAVEVLIAFRQTKYVTFTP